MAKPTVIAMMASALFAFPAIVGYSCAKGEAIREETGYSFRKTESEALEACKEQFPELSNWSLYYKYAVEAAEGYCWHCASDNGAKLDKTAVWRYSLEEWAVM